MPTAHSFNPLAARMRPQTIDQFFGQSHLLGKGKPLRKAWETSTLHSMILWGPPGSGKTTLAHLLAQQANAFIETASAVLIGVKDIRQIVSRAQERQTHTGTNTVLFIDEIHRFNKSQQDAFLPYVEDGTLTLIGATTENPSFELNNALLSRTRVYVLKRLEASDILDIINHALTDETRGLGTLSIDFPEALKKNLAEYADGDARQALNILEILSDFAVDQNGKASITEQVLSEVLSGTVKRFDKKGDLFHEQISALHKCVRGTAPDAALYWLARMLKGGCDPEYIARRVVRMASEDIGNADPRALTLALNAWETYRQLGSPEGELAIFQAVTYMACAPKSNAVYVAMHAAMKDAKENNAFDVPMHLRNAPTRLMKSIGYGKDYRYAHNETDAYAAGEQYFPEEMGQPQYYYPAPRGLELKIGEKLMALKKLDGKKQ